MTNPKTINEKTNAAGRVYFQIEGSHLRFSSRAVAERHERQARENMARFRAAIGTGSAEERAANMRAFFGIKAEG